MIVSADMTKTAMIIYIMYKQYLSSEISVYQKDQHEL